MQNRQIRRRSRATIIPALLLLLLATAQPADACHRIVRHPTARGVTLMSFRLLDMRTAKDRHKVKARLSKLTGVHSVQVAAGGYVKLWNRRDKFAADKLVRRLRAWGYKQYVTTWRFMVAKGSPKRIEALLRKIKGVHRADVSHGRATVEYLPARVSTSTIYKRLSKAGIRVMIPRC
ncbi:MAG: heavy-metal-associated domain-containing protein [Myxococcales bacterium]|nr:heavy-metal-associated domain-containing protein [Myxococcales bacterium]